MHGRLLITLFVAMLTASPALALHDGEYNDMQPDGTYACEADPGPAKNVEVTGGGIFLIYGGQFIYIWNFETSRYEREHPMGGTNYFEFDTDENGIGDYTHGYDDTGAGGGTGTFSSGGVNPTF